MFGHRYFGTRYYGGRYFGDGGVAAPVTVVVFSGLSTAGGVASHTGISRPGFKDAGVTRADGVSGNMRTDVLHRETYLDGGEIP